MNANRFKFLKLFADFARAGNGSDVVKKYMTALINLDFTSAAEVWEFFAADTEDDVYGELVFKLFFVKSASRTVRLLCDCPALAKAVYGRSANIGTGEMLGIVSDLVMAGKLDDADELLKAAFKNPNVSFGAYMKSLVEKVFVEILKKNGNQRILMNRKTSAFLLGYISKIKTDEKALLEQRIKEIN